VVRLPAAPIDLDDDAAARGWVRAEVERLGSDPGQPALWALYDDRVEAIECPEPVDRERVLSFAFADLAGRAGVRRAFWVGDGRMPVDGGRRRAVCVLERTADGWWTAWRLVRFDATSRRIALLGPWHEAQGLDPAPPGIPFDGWLAPAALAAAASGVDVRVGTGTLDGDLPGTALGVLEGVAHLLYAQLAEEGGLDCDLVAVFHGRSFRLWEIRGALPAPFDDLVRTLVAGADAVVVLRLEPGGDPALLVRATAERGQGRAAHRLTLHREGGRIARSEIAPIDAGDREWLGVRPRTPIELRGEGGWGVDVGEG
jgi:hypothetical protein